MLKFLTHKLRTHSINENNFEKENEHDSGTESDDEIESSQRHQQQQYHLQQEYLQQPNNILLEQQLLEQESPEGISFRQFQEEEEEEEERDPVMEHQRICSVSPADTGCSMSSPVPDQQDAHSSEEELEVINSQERDVRPLVLRVSGVSGPPEKRKWSQVVARNATSSPENEENVSRYGNLSPCKCGDTSHTATEHSSDEEVQNFLQQPGMTTPVQFRTSPPREAVKPGGRWLGDTRRSSSPPAKIVHYEVSPRKRSRRHVHMQRPYLDFEKMQQLKTRSVAWKHSADHGGELSVYCW